MDVAPLTLPPRFLGGVDCDTLISAPPALVRAQVRQAVRDFGQHPLSL